MGLNHGTGEPDAREDTFDHIAQQKAVVTTDNSGDSQQQQQQQQQSCISPQQEQGDANVAPADQLVKVLLEASKRVTRSTTRRVSQEAAVAAELVKIEKLDPSQEGDAGREDVDDAEYVPEQRAVSRNTRSRSSSVSSSSSSMSGTRSGRGRSSTRSTAKRTSTGSVDLSYIETNKRGSIRVTRNVNAISERKMTEPVVYPESDVLYIYDVSDWDNKMSFYDKIAYSFGVPSTQKVVFCHYFNCKVMHYERTCQGVYHCPKREEFEELQKKGESLEGGLTEEGRLNYIEMRDKKRVNQCTYTAHNTDFMHCTVKPSRFRFHTCQQHQTPLKRSKKCKFKLHFYVPQDKDDNRRLLLCIGTHSHALLPEDPRNPVTRGIVSHSDTETSPKTKSRTRTRSNSVSSTSTTSSKSRTRGRRKPDEKLTSREVKKRTTPLRSAKHKSVVKHELSDNDEDGWSDNNNDGDRGDDERRTTKRPKITNTHTQPLVPQHVIPQQPLLSQYPLSQPHQYMQSMYDPHQVPQLHSQLQMQQTLLQQAQTPAHLQQMLLNIQQLQQQQQLLQQTQPQYQLAMIQAQLQQQQQQLRLSMQLASHLQQVQAHNALIQQQHQQPPQVMYQPPHYQQPQQSTQQQQASQPQYGHPEQDKTQSHVQVSQSQQSVQPQRQKEQQQQHRSHQLQSRLEDVEHIENTPLERSDAAIAGSDLISQLPQGIGNQSGTALLPGSGGHSNSNHSLGINTFGYGTNSNHSFSLGFFNPSHSFGPSNGSSVGFHSFAAGGYPFQNVTGAPLNSSWSYDQWPSGNSLHAMFDHGESSIPAGLPPIGNLDREESLISSAEQSSVRPSMQNGLITDVDMGGHSIHERDGLHEIPDEAGKRKGNPISLSAFFNDPQYPHVFYSNPNNSSNTICFASSDDVAKFVADSKSSGMQRSTRENVNVGPSDDALRRGDDPVSGAGSVIVGNTTADDHADFLQRDKIFAYPRGSIKSSHAVGTHETMLPPTHTTKNKHVLRLISEDSEHSTSVSLPPISSLTGSQRWWDEALKGDKHGDSNSSSSNSFSVSSTNQCDSIGTAPGDPAPSGT